MTKLERINGEIERLKKKITEYQNRVRDLEKQKTETENSEIVDIVRGGEMTAGELAELIKAIREKEKAADKNNRKE